MARLVALRFSDPVELLAALDEVWAAGDAALPLDASAPDATATALLDRLRPSVVRDEAGTTDLGHDATLPPDTALVVATSGSTGAPKGIVLSHAALAASTARSRSRTGAGDGVPWLGVLPLHHVAGISVVLRSRAAGREPLLHRRVSGSLVDGTESSWMSLVPTQLAQLLDEGADLARHAGVLLGGAAAPPALLRRAGERGVHVVTTYGATETCGGCVYDGRPLDDVEIRLDAESRVGLRTPTVGSGTWDGVAVTPVVDAEGWWWTSDLGRLDDGVLTVIGRADDVVVSGGENVPLAPVRGALAQFTGLTASGVVGLPHERWGTAVAAVVVPDRAAPPPTLSEVRDALRTLLPPSHLPTVLVHAVSLPTDGMGKLTTTSVTAALRTGVARRAE